VYFLGKTPRIITMVPGSSDLLLPEDIAKIKESLEQGFSGGTKNFNGAPEAGGAKSGSDEALKQALDLLSKQTDQNKALQETLAKNAEALESLQKKVEVLEGAGKNPSPPVGQNPSPPVK
jgi:hypothetical protein